MRHPTTEAHRLGPGLTWPLDRCTPVGSGQPLETCYLHGKAAPTFLRKRLPRWGAQRKMLETWCKITAKSVPKPALRHPVKGMRYL